MQLTVLCACGESMEARGLDKGKVRLILKTRARKANNDQQGNK